jgi:O-antigen biosynthesis protein
MPVISVFTPSHRSTYLDECWQSLRAQSFNDWEWLVLLSAGAVWKPPDDARVRVIRADDLRGVGAVKRRACELLHGEVFVELDHDDLLASTALERIAAIFAEHADVGFVYSDWAQIADDGSRDDSRFDEANGWEYTDTEVDGRPVLGCRSLEPLPHNLSYIWFAPNHVRAFRRSDYEAVGGYDPARDVLDDQDLMARLYQRTEFHRIPECLYLQRMHAGNTQLDPTLNPRIQEETLALYERDVQANALAWARRHGLMALQLGGTGPQLDGFTRLDGRPDANIVADLNTSGIPLPDDSVGLIRAVDFLPLIADRLSLFNELHRVLAHGGLLLTLTPSTDGRGAFLRPDSLSFYNETSFWPFTNRAFATPADKISCRFQVSRMQTYFLTDWHETNQLPYVQANLIAVKDGPRLGGYLNI